MMRVLYKITNLLNGKCYIGQTKNFKMRMRDHIRTRKSLISQAINKYGKENFSFVQLESFDESEIDAAEKAFILKFNSLAPNGYNLDLGGKSVKESNDITKEKLRLANLGKKHTEITKQKMRESMTPQRKQKIIENFQSHPVSQEARAEQGKKMKIKWADPEYKANILDKIRITNQSKPKRQITEEQRQKMSAAHKGQKAWNKGVPLTQEAKRKLSDALRGRKTWNKGISPTEQTRIRQSQAHKSKSGILNISWNNLRKKWIVKDKTKVIGQFRDLEDAKKELIKYNNAKSVTTEDVSSKTRVTFTSTVNDSDEIILISNK